MTFAGKIMVCRSDFVLMLQNYKKNIICAKKFDLKKGYGGCGGIEPKALTLEQTYAFVDGLEPKALTPGQTYAFGD